MWGLTLLTRLLQDWESNIFEVDRTLSEERDVIKAEKGTFCLTV